MGQNAAPLIIFFLISLFVSSTLIGYFVVEQYGVKLDGVTLPESIASYSSEQNFSAGTYNTSTLSHTGNVYWEWRDNIGMYLVNYGAYKNYFLVDNINKDSSGMVTNYYIINNSVHGDYTIVLRYTGGYDSNEVEVKQDGFHFPSYSPVGGIKLQDIAFFPYPNANQIDVAKIKTIYYDGDKEGGKRPTVTFTFNDYTFTQKDMFYDQETGTYARYYGGINGGKVGQVFNYFRTDNLISGAGAENTNTLAMISSVIATMLRVVVWVLPENIMPLFIQLLLIKTQEVGLLIAIADWIRG
jgi:hypothetical protein